MHWERGESYLIKPEKQSAAVNKETKLSDADEISITETVPCSRSISEYLSLAMKVRAGECWDESVEECEGDSMAAGRSLKTLNH